MDNMLNNLTLLRNILSYIVLVGHTIELMHYERLMPLTRFVSPNFAVHAFFIISGVVVYLSWQRHPQLVAFCRKRVLRLFPGYIATVVLSGLAIWFFMSDRSIDELWRYYAANLSLMNFLHPDIAGAFQENPMSAVNGALWTIKVEVMFYASIPVSGLLIWYFGLWRTAIAMSLVGFAWPLLVDWAGVHYQLNIPEQVSYQLPGQLHYFGLGILLGVFHSARKKDPKGFRRQAAIAVGLWLLFAVAFQDVLAFAHLAVGAFLVICLPLLPVLAPTIERNDISYGIYLLHFPVIQTTMALLGNSMPFGISLLLVTSVTVVLALILHISIEKPAIDYGKKKRTGSAKTEPKPS
jgi:peptidoglycan/LPS O-acetylase OafA/YrhL